jgi:hypothetical protein
VRPSPLVLGASNCESTVICDHIFGGLDGADGGQRRAKSLMRSAQAAGLNRPARLARSLGARMLT